MTDKFIRFTSDISKINLPLKFNFPHNYIPHELAQIAAQELQESIISKTDFNHNFGHNTPNDTTAIGKMFGVLVVKTTTNTLGYLAAFSGKLGKSNLHKYFVPPVFNILDENGFYKATEIQIDDINCKIDRIKTNPDYLSLKLYIKEQQDQHQQRLNKDRQKIEKRRKERRQAYKQDKLKLSEEDLVIYQEKLNQLNLNEAFFLKEYEAYLSDNIKSERLQYQQYTQELSALKSERKRLSSNVQKKIFKHYAFLNTKGETKHLLDLFSRSKQNIPAGAGDCCAPKLLQYAFLNHLTPITMAEFWWGKPLETSVRKHQNFYPACIGKCKPILQHMLKGLHVENNPLLHELTQPKALKIIFEDEALIVINKPHEFLSVDGTEIKDSVYSRIKQQFPKVSGPLIVHRLDMSTSGILVIAKTKDIHKKLQAQFINKTVKKRYVAILDGVLKESSGDIRLPLRTNFIERPKQMVCFSKGKESLTKWSTISKQQNTTRVYFYPVTGRTHQLRMHAAHYLGLNTPILGDDLYGKKANRLYLHAEYIQFTHPITNTLVDFYCKAAF